jgi:hypothetical protein
LVGPKGLASNLVQRWYNEMGATVCPPQFARCLTGIGFVPFVSKTQQFAHDLAKEQVDTYKIIRKLGFNTS